MRFHRHPGGADRAEAGDSEFMQLIIFAGLPGTGKSSIAEAIGRQLAIPDFAKDWLEAALVRNQLRPAADDTPALGLAAYELLTTLADRQLQLGQRSATRCWMPRWGWARSPSKRARPTYRWSRPAAPSPACSPPRKAGRTLACG